MRSGAVRLCYSGIKGRTGIALRTPGPGPWRTFQGSPRRWLAAPKGKEAAEAFLRELGYEEAVAGGIVKALKDSGVPASGLASSVKQLAGRWEVGEDAGLEALADSVEKELAEQQQRAKVMVVVVPPGAEEDRAFTCTGYEGMSLTDVVKKGTDEGAATLGEYIECACAGVMACSTCHVVVHPDWFDKVGAPDEPEQDMLDLAFEPRDTSRLGCQIKLRADLDGMVVMVPVGSNNLMDFIDPRFRD